MAARLQPKFTIDEATALGLANPTTQTLDQRFADILTGSLMAALPTTARTTTTTVAGDPAAGLATDYNRVTTDQSGTTAGMTRAALPAATAAALSGLGADPVLQRDPMMRYLAATAVFQEINLLNRYITDVVRIRDAQAYVVRLQLSVVPTRRNMPYDVMTDITIHGSDEQVRSGLAAGPDPRCSSGTNMIRIVPLLVTDNLESLGASRTQDEVRQLGLALLATAGNVGLGGDLSRTQEALQRSVGEDVNSLLTVARLSDDTVRVRLGAANSPRFGNVLVPRTHNISLLVLYSPCKDLAQNVESEQRMITAVTRTAFHDTRTGEALPYDSYGRSLYGLSQRLNDKYPSTLEYNQYLELFQLVSRQDRDGFERTLDEYARHDPRCAVSDRRYDAAGCAQLPIRIRLTRASLWTDLISARPSGEFSFANIPLELRRIAPTAPNTAQTVVVTHDTAAATATLLQARDLPTSPNMQATLVATTVGTRAAPSRTLRIPASEVAVAPGGRAVSLRFPALAAYGFAGQPLKIGEASFDATIELQNLSMGPSAPVQSRTFRSVLIVPAAVPAPINPVFRLNVAASTIMADPTGQGRVNIAFTPVAGAPAAPLRLVVAGADVAAYETVRGTGLTNGPLGWQIFGAGEVRLTLTNLTPGQTVTFSTIVDDGTARGPAVSRTITTGGAAPKSGS